MHPSTHTHSERVAQPYMVATDVCSSGAVETGLLLTEMCCDFKSHTPDLEDLCGKRTLRYHTCRRDQILEKVG